MIGGYMEVHCPNLPPMRAQLFEDLWVRFLTGWPCMVLTCNLSKLYVGHSVASTLIQTEAQEECLPLLFLTRLLALAASVRDGQSLCPDGCNVFVVVGFSLDQLLPPLDEGALV